MIFLTRALRWCHGICFEWKTELCIQTYCQYDANLYHTEMHTFFMSAEQSQYGFSLTNENGIS